MFMILQNFCSAACAINLGSSVILTGGRDTYTTVTEYNEDGFVRDLPPLQEGRWTHGCSYFNNNQGTKVRIQGKGRRQS